MSHEPTAGPPPLIRLRRAGALLDLPWEVPLRDWPASLAFQDRSVGPSRHLVRFLVVDGALLALKEEPADVAEREYEILGHLERAGLPAVSPVGIVRSADGVGIVVTEYLRHSLQFRRLLLRFPLGPGAYRDRLLDAMAGLLVDLHRGGVYWGDCSLANTLFRRDGDRIQAFLVDAETSEVHQALSDGQREFDLEILVENVGFGLADVAIAQNRPEGLDDAIEAAESVRTRYKAIWEELHLEPELPAGDRHAIRRHLRRLNELGFAVDEIEVIPTAEGSRVRLRVTTTNRDFHAHELERLTGIRALEGQARLLLNDLREHVAWLEATSAAGETRLDERTSARRWRTDVLEPTLRRLRPVIGPARDPLQAYCDVLEHKWLLSERAGHDVGLDAAIAAYVAEGAPAPEADATSDPDAAGDSDLIADPFVTSDPDGSAPRAGDDLPPAALE
jgi:hypothetical protein